MLETGELKRIWVKPATDAPMRACQGVELVAGKGIVGDAQFAARRPVTLISEERCSGWSSSWDLSTRSLAAPTCWCPG